VNIGLILRGSNILVRRIDSLDAAGPYIDYNYILYRNISNACRFSQCVHTSWDLGTIIRNDCSRNWIMGYLGIIQPAANYTLSFRNHGYVMRYYVTSYTTDFIAQKNPYAYVFPGKQGDWCNKTVIMGARTDEDL
jgi:hypothetical protein